MQTKDSSFHIFGMEEGVALTMSLYAFVMFSQQMFVLHLSNHFSKCRSMLNIIPYLVGIVQCSSPFRKYQHNFYSKKSVCSVFEVSQNSFFGEFLHTFSSTRRSTEVLIWNIPIEWETIENEFQSFKINCRLASFCFSWYCRFSINKTLNFHFIANFWAIIHF